MDILGIKVEDLLKFPFKEKDWINTFGIYVLITFLTTIGIALFTFIFMFTGIILIEVGTTIPIASLFLFLLLISPFILASLLIQMYLQGYLLEIIDNIKNKKLKEFPKHGEIGKKMRLGFAQLAIWFGPAMICLVILALSITILVAGIMILGINTLPAILLIVFGVLSTIISSLALMVVGVFIFPAMLYTYLEKKSLASAYCFKNIKIVLKNSWKEFLLLYAISMIASMLISAIGQLPLLGFLVILIGIPYISFLIAFVTGNIFHNLDKLKLFK